jgi:bifunctional UDP-N-acetylglucosamine pyrophosphorylase/glucosamine-1-phosphate N-acetyltransferase
MRFPSLAVGFSSRDYFRTQPPQGGGLAAGPGQREKCDNSPLMEMPLQIAILAAGEGKRMRSALPKVLHLLGGRPLLEHVLGTARSLDPRAICIVCGGDGGALRRRFPDNDLAWALQEPPAGTADALKRALTALAADGVTLVLFGADPLARPETLRSVAAHAQKGALSLLTIYLEDPSC